MSKPTFTITSPTDLIALAPIVLGFHPEDSVVLLGFGGRDPFSARVDMPLDTDERRFVVRTLIEPVRRHRLAQVAVLIFSDDQQAARSVAHAFARRLSKVDTTLIDIIRADGERYDFPLHPYVEAVRYDVSAHPFAAEAVLMGRRTLPNRDALADRLVGCDEDQRDAVRAAAIAGAGPRPDPEADRVWLRGLSERAASGHFVDAPLDARDAGRLLLLISDEAMSQVVLEQILHRALADDPAEQLTRLADFWADLVRRSPEELVAPVAAVLAFTAWQSGDGAFAWCAVERALAEDPDHVLAHAVSECLQEAVPPARRRSSADEPPTGPGNVRRAS